MSTNLSIAEVATMIKIVTEQVKYLNRVQPNSNSIQEHAELLTKLNELLTAQLVQPKPKQ